MQGKRIAPGKKAEKRKHPENDGTSGFLPVGTLSPYVSLLLEANTTRNREAVQQNAVLRCLFSCSQQPEQYAAWSYPVTDEDRVEPDSNNCSIQNKQLSKELVQLSKQ